MPAALTSPPTVYRGSGIYYTTPVNASSSGANTIVTCPNSQACIRVHSCLLMADAAVDADFESDTGTIYLGPVSIGETGGFSLQLDETGWFVLPEGKNLVLDLGSAVQVGGIVKYSLIYTS